MQVCILDSPRYFVLDNLTQSNPSAIWIRRCRITPVKVKNDELDFNDPKWRSHKQTLHIKDRIFFCSSSLIFALRRKRMNGLTEQGTRSFCDSGIYCYICHMILRDIFTEVKRYHTSNTANHPAIVFLNNRWNKPYATLYTLFLKSLYLYIIFFFFGFLRLPLLSLILVVQQASSHKSSMNSFPEGQYRLLLQISLLFPGLYEPEKDSVFHLSANHSSGCRKWMQYLKQKLLSSALFFSLLLHVCLARQ